MLKKIFLLSLIYLYSSFTFAYETITIKNIKVSASNKNATIARNSAIEKAQIRGFQELIKRHYPEEEAKASSLKNTQIFKTVESFQISNEKRSAMQYFARVNVIYNQNLVEELLGNPAKIDHTETQNGVLATPNKEEAAPSHASNEISQAHPTMDTLIIPIYEEDSHLYWLDEQNKWYDFWNNKIQKSSISNKFTLPSLDLEDISLINKNIFNKNIIDLSPLFEKYDINNVAVVKFKVSNIEDKDHYSVQISYINRFSSSWQKTTLAEKAVNNESNAFDAYFTEIENFPFSLNESFVDSLNTKPPKKLKIDFPLSSISEWLSLNKILSNIKYVTDVNLVSISSDLYQFELTYNIDISELEKILKSYNYSLQKENKIYLLQKNNMSEF